MQNSRIVIKTINEGAVGDDGRSTVVVKFGVTKGQPPLTKILQNAKQLAMQTGAVMASAPVKQVVIISGPEPVVVSESDRELSPEELLEQMKAEVLAELEASKSAGG